MLKILQARLQQYVNCELPDVQAGFRKGRGTKDQIANTGSSKKQESSRKTSTSALLTLPKPFTVCPGDLPNPGIEPESPALTGRFFTSESPGKAQDSQRKAM